MGRYSDSDEDSSRKLKKKKKRRSRSRSRSAESSSSRYSHSHKHKKSKKKHRQRSRSYSRSPERHSRRDRSPPRRRRSRSPDRSRRSRSSDRGRRSRSYERKRRSRSRSDSRDRVSSRRRSTSRERSRRSRSDSGSRSQYDSRRSSAERKKGRRGSTSPTPHAVSTSESNALDEIPGFKDMTMSCQTPAEQAQMRLKMALRAATMSDEKLKEQSPSSAQGAPVSSPLSRQQFAEAVATIDADSFVPTSFKSSRSSKSLKETREAATELPSHNMAMFGAVGNSVVFTKAEPVDKSSEALEDNPETLFADCLKVDPEEKMARWIQKLTALRRKRLEGEAIDSY
ncbi:uncharacterized protein LOC143289232 isoform X2 [Babylonia areolata]|uniref:uncharacterized protein LOC143289232 isoform X2 n=1 Tax=Babylonia areolata TaxID=304850 RepID=UPI003FD0A9F5